MSIGVFSFSVPPRVMGDYRQPVRRSSRRPYPVSALQEGCIPRVDLGLDEDDVVDPLGQPLRQIPQDGADVLQVVERQLLGLEDQDSSAFELSSPYMDSSTLST